MTADHEFNIQHKYISATTICTNMYNTDNILKPTVHFRAPISKITTLTSFYQIRRWEDRDNF
jgi:hypothetical protein